MTTLTVPEILGWEWKTLEGRRWLCPPDSASTSVAAVSPEAARIAVDDMLGWLAAHGWGWEAAQTRTGDIRVTAVNANSNRIIRIAGTLHEALEATVVAIAEREESADE